MTTNQTIMKVCAELGLKTYAVSYETNSAGSPRNFKVVVYDRVINGGTTRAVIRALRRHFCQQPKSPLKTT